MPLPNSMFKKIGPSPLVHERFLKDLVCDCFAIAGGIVGGTVAFLFGAAGLVVLILIYSGVLS